MMVDAALTGPRGQGAFGTVPMAEHPRSRRREGTRPRPYLSGAERGRGPDPFHRVQDRVVGVRITSFQGGHGKPIARGAQAPQRMRDVSCSECRRPKGKGNPITCRIGPRRPRRKAAEMGLVSCSEVNGNGCKPRDKLDAAVSAVNGLAGRVPASRTHQNRCGLLEPCARTTRTHGS
jgi:hypothetical protein